RRGRLNVPVIGVARSGWNLDDFKSHVRDAIGKSGDFDERSASRFIGLLQYVDGDYRNNETFNAMRAALGNSRHPLFYLAIPPSMFSIVVESLGASGCSQNARVVVEKP